MKKTACIFIALAISLSLCACGLAAASSGDDEPIDLPETLESKNLVAAPTPSPDPTQEPTIEPAPEYFVVSMIGDCTFAGSQYIKGTSYSFEGVVGEDYAYPFAETLRFFMDDDLTLANLECTFSDQNLYPHTTFGFLAPTAYVDILSEGSVEFVTTANNHSNDFGSPGYEDTVTTLQNAGIGYAGNNETALYVTESGFIIGIYAAGFSANEFDITAGIHSLRTAGAEFIIAAFHWGFEGSYHETNSQIKLGHAAVDAGADLVYGCHAHVLQRVEEYGGTYILYSLGNWSFGGNTSPRDLDSVIARVTVKRDVCNTVSVEGIELIPCTISGTKGNNYQPVPYQEGSDEYLRTLSKLDGTFTGPDLTVDYSYYHRNNDADGVKEVAEPEGSTVEEEGSENMTEAS